MVHLDVIRETLEVILAETRNLADAESPSVKHLCGLVAALVSQVGEMCAYVAISASDLGGTTATVPVDSGAVVDESSTSGH